MPILQVPPNGDPLIYLARESWVVKVEQIDGNSIDVMPDALLVQLETAGYFVRKQYQAKYWHISLPNGFAQDFAQQLDAVRTEIEAELIALYPAATFTQDSNAGHGLNS